MLQPTIVSPYMHDALSKEMRRHRERLDHLHSLLTDKSLSEAAIKDLQAKVQEEMRKHEAEIRRLIH